MITKKITVLVFLIFFSINVFAKYKYEKLADFEWNNKSGFETKLTHSGNYAILSFEILDNKRVAFLSNVEKNIKIYSKDGKFLNAFDLDFIPEDFVYNNNKFYVLSNYSIYEFNDSGALIKKYSVNKEFKFINRLSAFKNDLYVLTSDEKSYPVIKNSFYLDTISQINNEINGWLLEENFKCKTIKLSNNTFSLQISNQKNLNLEKIYDLDKKLATVTILGKYKSKLFLNIEYFKNEVPIKIEREILVYSLTEKEIVNKMKLPNMHFIYMKHDIKINDNGVFYFIATPKKGILYQLIYDEKLNKDIVPNFKEEYHYNEHLLRIKEESIKNSFPKEELPISRAEIIQNAAEYESIEWTATSSNISDGIVQTPDGAYIDTPDWVTIGQKQKVPYKWGGWTEINTFAAQISNGVYAGDNYCESVSWGSTYCVGVDCSGLVSRAWDLSDKYGTYTLPDISTAYSTFNELKHGDIINKAGYHVRLVISDNPTGTINTIESSAVDWRVSYRNYDLNDLADYTPRYYNYIQNLEMASSIVITPNPMIYEEQVTATVSITNFEDVDWAGNIYMAIHDNNGNFLYNIDAEEGEGVTIANNETEDFEFQDILEFDNYNGPGIYEIHLKYQTNGTGDFYLVPPVDNYTNPIDVEIVETTIINVPGDYPTIQAGIDAASDGNTVLVQPGTYYENINFNGKNITVGSLFLTTQDSSYISQTIIDGNQNGSVVTFENVEDTTAVLSGFTITNGYSGYVGGGIDCYYSNPSLDNVTITSNSAIYKGGGIYCDHSSPNLKNVTISGNSSNFNGGGIYSYSSSLNLQKVTITGNFANSNGGGISCYDSSPSLANVTITGNSATYGGGIYFDESSPSFDIENRCDIYNNVINNRGYGLDIFAFECDTINVIVDTFTILTPTDYYASPIDKFTFDILHSIQDSLINADLYVSVNGNNSNLGTSPDEPFKTINHALSIIYSDSLNRHTIYLSPGVYSPETNGEEFPIEWSNYVSLEGISETETILDADSFSGVLRFNYVTEAIIKNLTIRNGNASFGGGICCYYSNQSMVNVTIIGNSASDGGGIYCSDSSPNLINVTIIGNSAADDGGGIYCHDYSSPSIVNVTISGNSADDDGGGIYCHDYSSPSIVNVTITGNSAHSGGGISFVNSSPSLENVTIIGNSVTGYYSHGGGIYCSYNSNPSLENVTIIGNSSYASGGGIYCDNNSNPSLENVTIIGNSAYYGGGIYCNDNSSPSLENVTIIENSANSQGGGISCRNNSSPSLENVTIIENSAYHGGGIYCHESSPSFKNCILWNDYPQEIYFYVNSTSAPDTIIISYSDIQGGEEGIVTYNNGIANWLEGNIDADPLFLDPSNGDYHLTENSPCIDAGDPDSPLDPDGTRADMGAYYYDQGDIILIWPGDTDYNGIVNEVDILPIGVYWRDTGFPRSSISFEWVGNDYPGGWEEPIASLADCNGDGEVNITDVLAICLNWNKTHSTVLESPFIPNNLEQYRDNFVEIYNSLGNSEIEIKIRNYIAEKFDLPIIEIIKVNKLCQNYPNPFNPETTIEYSLKESGNICLEIYNIRGQKVNTLFNEFRKAGYHSVIWSGKDINDNPVSSGIYLYKLNVNGKTEAVKKCLLLK